MKKTSLMGASVVAAALLAVAPVAAPAISSVSGVQTVKAAENSSDPEYTAATKALALFDDSASIDLANAGQKQAFNNSINDLYRDAANTQTVSTLINTNNAQAPAARDNFLKLFQPTVPAVTQQNPTNSVSNYNIKASVSDSNGALGTTGGANSELVRALTAAQSKGGVFKVTYTISNPRSSDVTSKTLTLNVTPANKLTNLYIKAQTPFEVSKGSKVDAYNYGSAAGVSVTDQNGNAVDAYNNGNNVSAVVQRSTNTTANQGQSLNWGDVNVALHPTFLSTNPNNSNENYSYRQKVTIKFNSGFDLDTVNVNGKDLKVTPAVTGANPAPAQVTFYRDIKLVNANQDFTMDKINGVITTKDYGVNTVPLYDKNGKVITMRSVAGNTNWFTNGKRTILATNKTYYKVSPTEYISADDVASYEDKGTSSSSSDANTGFVKEKGVFTVGGNPDYHNPLAVYKNGKFETIMRNVAADSTWRYDKKMSADGYTYYKVSPTEWVSTAYGTAVAD